MNTQYGKSAALPDYVPQWKVDAIIAHYQFQQTDEWQWLGEQIAAGIAEYGEDDGYPLDDWGDSVGIRWMDDRGETFSRSEGLERRS